MKESFKIKIQQAEQGKKLFETLFDIRKLNIEDSFLLVLTDNEECIFWGIKYLPKFIQQYKKNVYVLLSDIRYAELFSEVGGNVKICGEKVLENLASYFKLFHNGSGQDTRIIFLTDKDGYGLPVEGLLQKGEITLEEYIAILLYQLKEMKAKKDI